MGIFTKNKPKEEKRTQANAPADKPASAAPAQGRTRIIKSIILRPHASEKAVRDEAQGRYVFWVVRNAGKPEIRKEIQERYGVTVRSVNTVIKKGRETKWRGKVGKRQITKKAIITLKPGDKIEH